MKKDFRLRLEEYLVSLEKELGAPERYRNYIMGFFAKAAGYSGYDEISDEEFERIKSAARKNYASALKVNEQFLSIQNSLYEAVNRLDAIAEQLDKKSSELEAGIKDLEEIQALLNKKPKRNLN